MSANKYANLPDIDTAPDVYETEDVFPSSREDGGDSTDDEPSTTRARAKAAAHGMPTNREELDVSNLISPEQASNHFRKAERVRRPRTRYAYPPSSSSSSPTRSRSRSPTRMRTHGLSLPARLRLLQADLAALESELEDPSNPALQARAQDGEGVDPGEMIMGLVDVRRRLERVRWGREGRGRLVGVVVGEGRDVDKGGDADADADEEEDGDGDEEEEEEEESADERDQAAGRGGGDAPDARRIVEIDKRVGELEKLVGSVSATLDETTPLTPPLLPTLMRLNNQLTLLTQPRHIDSVSRRLKLLLSDLERVSASQMQKRQQAGGQGGGTASVTVLTPAQDAVLPLLTRLAPSLPHIPHILTRLRTLSALHGSASEFQNTMAALEEEQRRTKEALEALSGAVADVEASLEANRSTVAGNVNSLEERVETVLNRLEEVAK